jgi:hypothetical protein
MRDQPASIVSAKTNPGGKRVRLEIFWGFLSILAILGVGPAAQSATLNVPIDYLLGEALIQAETGDTILIQPGTHLVDDELEVFDNDLTIRGDSGNPADVIIQNDDGEGPFFTGQFLNGLRIERLTLRGADSTIGGAFSFLESQLEMSNCIIRNCTGARGAAAVVVDCSAVIRDCTFLNNIGSVLPPSFPLFFDIPGGALAVLTTNVGQGQVALIDCAFIGNESRIRNGGAVAIYRDTTGLGQKRAHLPKGFDLPPEKKVVLSATGCLFLGNTSAEGRGGALYLEKPTDDSGSVVELDNCFVRLCEAPGGGGLAFNRREGHCDLRIRSSTFEHNRAMGGEFKLTTVPEEGFGVGGGVLIYEATPVFSEQKGFHPREEGVALRVQNCFFNQNTASDAGGGLGIVGNEYRTAYLLEDNLFRTNYGPLGGGLFIGRYGDILAKGIFEPEGYLFEGRVLNNVFLGNGQEIFIQPPGKGNVNQSRLGGGAYIQESSTTLRSNLFRLNLAERGGGLYLDNDGSLVMLNFFGDPQVDFDELGGFRAKGMGGNPPVEEIGLPGNIALLAGAAIYVQGSALPQKVTEPGDRPPRISSNLFYGNFSQKQSGGVQISAYPLNDLDVFLGGNVFLLNYALDGSSVGINEEELARDGSVGTGMAIIHNTVLTHHSFCDLFEDSVGVPEGCDQPSSDSIIYLGPNAEPLIANNLIVAGTELTDATGIFEAAPLAPRILSNVFHNVTQLYWNDGAGPASLFGLNNEPQNGGNFTADPVFETPGPDSFNRLNPHLAPGSPLIDQATDLAMLVDLATLLPYDIDTLYRGMGDPRLLEDAREIGADERENVPTPTPSFSPTLTPTQTETPTATSAEDPTATPTETETSTLTPTLEGNPPTSTPTLLATPSATASATAEITATLTPTVTPGPLDEPELLQILEDLQSGEVDVQYLLTRSLYWKEE